MDSSSSASQTFTENTPDINGMDSGGQSALQKHVSFFDRNEDGVIYPWETFKGLRSIGCGIFLSLFASIFVNVAFSWKTRPGKFPSLLFPIVVKNIKLAKHRSDTGVYDSQGRFIPSKFAMIFSQHARTNPCALTSRELRAMIWGNREPMDFVGWFTAYVEWKILYLLFKDDDGLLQRETIEAVYDGSLFEDMAKKKKDSVAKQMSVYRN